MSFALLRDLRDLKVLVLHPNNAEGQSLTEHLRRIGCTPTQIWPVPPELPLGTDVVFLAIEDDARPEIERFIKNQPKPGPTMLAIVGYENPSTLQIVLESGAQAVVERPIKPFGLLTNLAIARNLWLEQQRLLKEARKYRRKAMGDQQLARAKAILMAHNGATENEAYQDLRRQAMERRVSIEEVAKSIVLSEEHLRASPKRA
ncbi:ANTAR domain-containing protein [Shinella sp. AETb1-6]|jgi:AmiR/NasT family two-component response regulator|uniref:ANTAR domain-containing protein n=2 Tax=Shinella TaxID=323620 RepID=A0AA50CRA6_9HYPH|nr:MULTISPECIES: ANTAR domain-containing protein [Shinella]MDP9587675.1 AmiR/NasT family two-component response regulator [Shinella zoogloeoides]MCD1262105.1 ANTAR domain-containing protein [Shinella sumterensis]MXN51648.1 ANTAR domain-containing protein [Shinella sp. AETb1-6]TFE95972.1 antitermination regulator [Shinella sumterensis]UPA26542.1 ANTAR domain-containing protein [Shinella oryzae]